MKQWLFDNSAAIACVSLALSPVFLALLQWGMTKLEDYLERRKEK